MPMDFFFITVPMDLEGRKLFPHARLCALIYAIYVGFCLCYLVGLPVSACDFYLKFRFKIF